MGKAPTLLGLLSASAPATLPAAPTFVNAISLNEPGSAATHSMPTASLSVSGNRLFGFVAWSNSPGFTSFEGDTDDTSAELQTIGATPKGHSREFTVVSGLDTNWVFTPDSSTVRAVLAAVSVSGSFTLVDPAIEVGTAGDPPAHPETAIGSGPHNALVFAYAWLEGGHSDLVVPTGWTEVFVGSSGTSPTSGSRVTFGLARRTFSNVSSIPAASWSGLASQEPGQTPRAGYLICYGTTP